MTQPTLTTARDNGLVMCHTCGTLCRQPSETARYSCPLCGAKTHQRKPHSLLLAWLYTLAATLLYIPANTLPMMVTRDFTGAQSDTIFSGILYLWANGSAHLAVIVFIASIAVPTAKLMALYYLLISVQTQPPRLRHQRATLYRLLEFVGRWSMLDIFVVAILAALVNFPGVARVEAGPGAAAFGAVVTLTLIATQCFDPRLIWDNRNLPHVHAPH